MDPADDLAIDKRDPDLVVGRERLESPAQFRRLRRVAELAGK
jgi:hypothetical protein